MPAPKALRVHLLDVGEEEYGDALLCEFGKTIVLIDGAHPGNYERNGHHPSIPDQLDTLLGDKKTHEVSLLVVSHAHQDHVGCLPRLVKDDTLRAEAALLVHPDRAFPLGSDAFSGYSDAERRVVSALREEPLSSRTDAARIERFLEDAATLEDRYREMIETLRKRGTRIVRYEGRSAAVTGLEQAYRSIGLKVLGPSRAQIRSSADVIAGIQSDALAGVADLSRADAGADAVTLYRRAVTGATDLVDVPRNGAAVNLQSIVTGFRYGGRKLLFAGDMQFVSGAMTETIEREVEKLVAAIGKGAPYDLVKLSHHGSGNGFDEDIFDSLKGSKDFGICAGELSGRHPDSHVLELLDGRAGVKWARTDRNGLSTFRFGASGRPRIDVTRGKASDPEPNSDPFSAIPVTETRQVAGAGVVEVRTRVEGSRTTVTIDVGPPGATPVAAAPDRTRPALPSLRVAGGRRLPELLVLTGRKALADNIGRSEADQAIAAVRAAGLTVIDDIPLGAEPSAIARRVRDHLARRPSTAGVLVVGGYDVVPSMRLECLPADLRRRVREAKVSEPDDFVVWSDDVYGDLDGDFIAEIPVSRIPDGRSAALVFSALSADGRGGSPRRAGLRNRKRPFAARVFRLLPGTDEMLGSLPTTVDGRPAYDLSAERTYLMLHGDYADATTFRGEEDDYPVAMTVSNVPAPSGPVVFAGCCWGALPVDQPAGRVRDASLPNPAKTPDGSIALTYLLHGAVGFVGCTGAHWSPDAAGGYWGGPMHEAFWRQIAGGAAPAVALHRAKQEFASGMPHGRTTLKQVAIEFKIMRLFTCLGLGWYGD